MSNNYCQGTCVSIDGFSLLITGEAKSGKSSLALSLIEEGAKLVSDDVTFFVTQNQKLYAKSAEKMKGFLFIRGMGILSVPFEDDLTQVKAVIHLGEKDDISLKQKTILLSDVELPFFEFMRYDFALTNKIKAVIKLLKNEWTLIETE